MNRINRLVDFLLGIILGFSLALLITWWIIPLPRVMSTPSALHIPYKDEFRLLIALSYDATGDIERAQNRLLQLQEVDSTQSIIDQAVRFRSGQSQSGIYPDSELAVQYLALLARDLQIYPVQVPSPLQSTSTSGLLLPTVTYQPFILVSSDPVCDSISPGPVAQIYARDSAGQPLSAVPIVVAWESGQQKIFTGLKPEKGLGYADFLMIPGTSYSIQFPSASQVVTGISAPDCESSDGSTYPGGLTLIFQHP